MNMYFKNVKNKTELKRQYKLLSKQYHPDNLETGDSNAFIQIKREYDSLIKQFPTVKRVKITLGYEYCITGTEVNWLGYIIKIPKNYNKIKNKFVFYNEKTNFKYIITLEIVSDKNYIIKKVGKHFKPIRIIYVSLEDLSNGKVEYDDKVLTIPFKDGKMYGIVDGMNIELRLK